jgi:hypothetical protein
VTALIKLKSDETLCEDHDDESEVGPSERSMGEPSVPTSEESKRGVSGASAVKGSFESPLKRSDKNVLEDALTDASMTTERDEGAFGASKCKNASDPIVNAARRPGSIDESLTSEDSGPSTLSAVNEPAPTT